MPKMKVLCTGYVFVAFVILSVSNITQKDINGFKETQPQRGNTDTQGSSTNVVQGNFSE